MNSLIHLKKATPLLLIAFVLACLAVSPRAQADPNSNTSYGRGALRGNTTGDFNSAFGVNALSVNSTGGINTAVGFQALLSNTTGNGNTANGANALSTNTTGNSNTAYGGAALLSNTTGNSNTANGLDALFSNITGSNNTANGLDALSSNTTGSNNTAVGNGAGGNITTGSNNTANGVEALSSNTSGSGNVAIGFFAGSNLTTGDNNIDIGSIGVADEANTIRIGDQGTQTATFIAGISGATVTGTAVVVDGSGQLGVAASSARFKEAIKSMDNASEALFALKPVIFRYKKDIDPQGISQFGLVAEEVEAVNSDLVVRDKEGKPYTVRYEAVNAMLLNEFLKEHKKVEKLEAAVLAQQNQIKVLTAGLEKVSAQLKMDGAPRVVENTY